MRKSKYNSFDELPLMLTVEDVSHVLGIGLAHAYEVAHRRDFPTITLGSRIIVPRDKFMEWIDEQAAKNLKYCDNSVSMSAKRTYAGICPPLAQIVPAGYDVATVYPNQRRVLRWFLQRICRFGSAEWIFSYSYFGDSVVFVCVTEGGIINGKETSQR